MGSDVAKWLRRPLRASVVGCYLIAMSRLLTLIMIFALVMGHGSSVAAAICRHQSGGEHIAARQSHDAKISVIALGEEAAAAVNSKKSAPADGGSVSWPADMLPAPKFRAPFSLTDPVGPKPADAKVLIGTSVPPLLEPPTA